jgi:RNA polymerase nonessential primary-like sigma factor
LLHGGNPESLDVPADEDGSPGRPFVLRDLNIQATDRQLAHHESMVIEIGLGFCQLSGKQREVLTYLFGLGDGEPQSLQSVAALLDVSVERIKQIKYAALRILRSGRNDQRLRDFL